MLANTGNHRNPEQFVERQEGVVNVRSTDCGTHGRFDSCPLHWEIQKVPLRASPKGTFRGSSPRLPILLLKEAHKLTEGKARPGSREAVNRRAVTEGVAGNSVDVNGNRNMGA